MSRSFLDHITVTAFSLEAGAAFVSQTLGVSPQLGGEHPRMATHNRLLRLGDTMFLEIIAPNPAVPVPSRPRWFALDRLTPQSPPCLSTWVVRTADIHSTVSAASELLGHIEPMNRGVLNWLITIPADGSLPLDGAAPTLIEWQTDTHPAAKLEDKGLSLANLEIHHPNPDRLSRLLLSLDLDAPVSIHPSPSGSAVRLVANINTPRGLRRLSTPPPTAPAGRLADKPVTPPRITFTPRLTMQKIQIEGFIVSGPNVRTNNAQEAGASGKIPGLWAQFYASAPNPAMKTYGVYSDYESDASGAFTVTAGTRENTQTKPGVSIMSGTYLAFPAEGAMPGAIIDAWQAVWAYFSQAQADVRAYEADFEEYNGPESATIYIGIKAGGSQLNARKCL